MRTFIIGLAMSLAIGAGHAADTTCATKDDGLEAPLDQKAVYPLGFWRYASGTSNDRPRAELLTALECAIKRWRAATCLPINMDLDGPNFVRWQERSEMDGLSGRAITPWSAVRIHIDHLLAANRVCPVMIHEIGHMLRRSGAHPGPDGSMSHPVTHVDSPPVSKITQEDINFVCAVQNCACSNPE